MQQLESPIFQLNEEHIELHAGLSQDHIGKWTFSLEGSGSLIMTWDTKAEAVKSYNQFVLKK